MTMFGRSLLVALLCAVVACGTDPEPLNLAGRWSGATNDRSMEVTLTLTHDLSTNRLSGSWTVDRGASGTFSGTVEGRLSNKSITLTLHHEDVPSLYRYTGTVVGDGTLMGGDLRDAAGKTVRLEFTKE